MAREYTPSEIRDVGESTCPAIAASYDAFGSQVRSADVFKDSVFGSHEIGGVWIELFDLFKEAALETPISLEAMGRTLVEVADACDEDENEIVKDLEETMGAGEGVYQDDHRPDVSAEVEESQQPPESSSSSGRDDIEFY
ncbi:hypothetical protein GCM10029992_10520 [Glycomyces albus]